MKKLKNRKGFSLAEVLVAVLILAMVTSVVAAGMPAAINAYRKTVDSANAQLLLTTTANTLRNELDLARDVEIGLVQTKDSEGVTVNTATISYKSSSGTRSCISFTEGKSVKIREYIGYKSPDDPGLEPRPLVTDATASNTMYVEAESISLVSDGYVHFKKLTVKQDGNVLANTDEYVIKIMN